jgi:glycosyltransferase involved in cell wall biosynthesis
MSNKTLIVYIKPINTSFIRGDQKIFEKFFEVKSIQLNQSNGKFLFGLRLVKLFFLLLANCFRKDVLFVSWFADYHSAIMVFITKLMRKKSVIFIGGQEAISYPELKKGVYRKKFRGEFVKFALRNTSLIISNHKSLIYHENYYYNHENPHIDGIKHYVPGLKTPTEIIYNGIDPTLIKRDKSIKKQSNLVLTVGTMNQIGDFYNKGFDIFIHAASANKDLNFTLIGLNPKYINWTEENYQVSKISNLEIIPSFCPQEILNQKYNEAKVFVQASITEGMPNTLSEAMLLECIPVGSNVNGIPDAIGETGVIIEHRSAENLEKCIWTAMKLNTGKEARERVLNMFSFSRREKEILEKIQELIKI